jgi:hypothetical protein
MPQFKKRMRILYAGFLISAIFAVCGTAVAQSTVAASISITIATDQNNVQTGSEIKVAILLKNVSHNEIGIAKLLGGNRGDSFCALKVRDHNGNVPPKTELLREFEEHGTVNGQIALPMGSVFEQTVKPSESIKDWTVVSNIYDLTKPDRYRIQCQGFDEESKTVAKSNTITVTVTPLRP